MRHWEYLIASVGSNQPELSGLENLSEELEAEMEGAKDANLRQATAKAEAQQASRDREGFLFRGTELAYRLRAGIQTQYGFRSEKLVEFSMRPTRSRSTPKQEPGSGQPEPPVVEAQAPETKAPESKKKAPPAATTKVKSQ
jgi:hypothetical protein